MLEVQKIGDVAAPLTHAYGSYAPAGGFTHAYMPRTPMGGASNTVSRSGDYGLHVDNVVVYSGGPDEASKLRDDIEQAAQSRKQELGAAQ